MPLLFSYGTLQHKNVQIAILGRELLGREDALPGYARRMAGVANAQVASLSGQSQYVTVDPGANPEDAVEGTVFEVTDRELTAADQYEEAAGYRRIDRKLRSGVQAWLYIQA